MPTVDEAISIRKARLYFDLALDGDPVHFTNGDCCWFITRDLEVQPCPPSHRSWT
jgi:hypothetical protein